MSQNSHSSEASIKCWPYGDAVPLKKFYTDPNSGAIYAPKDWTFVIYNVDGSVTPSPVVLISNKRGKKKRRKKKKKKKKRAQGMNEGERAQLNWKIDTIASKMAHALEEKRPKKISKNANDDLLMNSEITKCQMSVFADNQSSGKSFDDLKTKRNEIPFENENLTLLAKLDSTPLSYDTDSKKAELKIKEKNTSEMIEKNDFLIETKDKKISKNRSSIAASIYDMQKERDLWQPMGQSNASKFSAKVEKQTFESVEVKNLEGTSEFEKKNLFEKIWGIMKETEKMLPEAALCSETVET